MIMSSLLRSGLSSGSPLRVLASSLSTSSAIKQAADKDFKLVSNVEAFNLDQELIHQKETKTIAISEPSNVGIVSGVPEEHIKTRTCRIYEPVKNSMQSGTNNIGHWEIEFDNRERWENPLMGWCSTGDPLSNMKIQFTCADEAIAYCKKYGYKYFVDSTTQKLPNAKSYSLNFHWNRRTRTSTK